MSFIGIKNWESSNLNLLKQSHTISRKPSSLRDLMASASTIHDATNGDTIITVAYIHQCVNRRINDLGGNMQPQLPVQVMAGRQGSSFDVAITKLYTITQSIPVDMREYFALFHCHQKAKFRAAIRDTWVLGLFVPFFEDYLIMDARSPDLLRSRERKDLSPIEAVDFFSYYDLPDGSFDIGNYIYTKEASSFQPWAYVMNQLYS